MMWLLLQLQTPAREFKLKFTHVLLNDCHHVAALLSPIERLTMFLIMTVVVKR